MVPPAAAIDLTSFEAVEGINIANTLRKCLQIRNIPLCVATAVLEMMRLLFSSVGLYGKALGHLISRIHLIHLLLSTIRNQSHTISQNVDRLFCATLRSIKSMKDPILTNLNHSCRSAVSHACASWIKRLERDSISTHVLREMLMEAGWERMSSHRTLADTIKHINEQKLNGLQETISYQVGTDEMQSHEIVPGNVKNCASEVLPQGNDDDLLQESEKHEPSSAETLSKLSQKIPSGPLRVVLAMTAVKPNAPMWQAVLFLHARLPGMIARLMEMAISSSRKGLQYFEGLRRFADAFDLPAGVIENSPETYIELLFNDVRADETSQAVLENVWKDMTHHRRQGVYLTVSINGTIMHVDTASHIATWTDARVLRAVEEFSASNKATCSLPPLLSAFQRKLVHSVCDSLTNINSRSEGNGKARHIVLSKTT